MRRGRNNKKLEGRKNWKIGLCKEKGIRGGGE
jgi:hypothetical protein